ncbi:MAG: hypothetical protein K2Y26_13215 [Gemmatimonadaceae bacterium]|nr:hypothetical protein [Gemmatimonadaceae bacterium]
MLAVILRVRLALGHERRRDRAGQQGPGQGEEAAATVGRGGGNGTR